MKPITFNSEMVKAILDGRKTQTRRLLKPQPNNLPIGAYCDPYNKNYEHFTFWNKEHKMILTAGGNIKNTAHWKCPYGKPGDRLWVRETWQRITDLAGYRYKATDLTPDKGQWKSPIFMPRWASRITLEITSIRVERLQEISLADAYSEGMENRCCNGDMCGCQGEMSLSDFHNLWDFLSKPGFKWEDSPWVWVIEFKKVK